MHSAAADSIVDSSVPRMVNIELSLQRWISTGCWCVPRTSSLRTLSRDSDISVPLSRSSFILSRSLRAVTTTGALVVRRICFARAKPMPLEAGEIRDQGVIVKECGWYGSSILLHQNATSSM